MPAGGLALALAAGVMIATHVASEAAGKSVLADASPSPSPTAAGLDPGSGRPLTSSVNGPGEHAHTASLNATYGLVETTTWYLNLSEDDDTVPSQQPAGRNPRYWPSYGTKRVPSGRLRLEIDHRIYTDQTSKLKPLTWVEDKRATLEGRARKIINDVAERAALVARQREEERRRWEAQHAEWEHRQRETKQQWQAAMDAALPQAVDALRHATLIAALRAWRDARDLREICAVLDSQAQDAQRAGQHTTAANLTRWCEAGLALAAPRPDYRACLARQHRLRRPQTHTQRSTALSRRLEPRLPPPAGLSPPPEQNRAETHETLAERMGDEARPHLTGPCSPTSPSRPSRVPGNQKRDRPVGRLLGRDTYPARTPRSRP